MGRLLPFYVLGVVLVAGVAFAKPEKPLALFPFKDAKSGKYGFLDGKGKVAIEPTWDAAHEPRGGLARVERAGKYGFVDGKGRVVIAPELAYVEDFADGLALVKDERGGYIDRKGKRVIDAAALGIVAEAPFAEGLAAAVEVKSGRTGFIDTKGRFAVAPGFADAGPFAEGLAAAQTDAGWGFVDRKGAWVIAARADVIARPGPFSGGRAWLPLAGGAWACVDRAGKTLFTWKGESAQPFSDGLALVEQGGKYGFVDGKGALAIAAEWDSAQPFSEGLAVVRRGARAGFVDVKGKVVIPLDFDDCAPMRAGLAACVRGEQLVYVDRGGKVLWTGPM
jgi:hypothetical protein